MSDDEQRAHIERVRARADELMRGWFADCAKDDELRAVMVSALRSMGYTVSEPEQ